MMNTIIFKPIKQLDVDEINLDIIDDILGDSDEDHNEIYEGFTRHTNEPIKIDRAIDILNQLKEDGANYVAIHYHTDHQGYEFYAQHISIATQKEIDLAKQRDVEYRIQYLKDKIKAIDKEKLQLEEGLKKILENT